MMADWESKKLGEVCYFENGDRGKNYPSRSKFANEGIPFVNAGHLENGEINSEVLNYITKENYDLLSRGKYTSGDILFCLRGSLGKFAIVKNVNNGAIASSLVIIRVKEDLYNEFLVYYLQSEICHNMISKYAGGTAQPNLGAKDLARFEIPIPPLSEQKRIVSKLDQYFDAIDKAKANVERNLQNAKELFQSQLNQIFSQKGESWVEKKLGEVCTYDKIRNERDDLPYVGLEHIESKTGIFIGSLEAHQVKSSTFYFNANHILYGRLRPYLNKVLIPDFEGHCSTEIFPILVNDNILREFLFYWFVSGDTVKKIDATWTGTRMPRANMDQVLEFSLPFPSIENQKIIVAQLEELSTQSKAIEFHYQQELDALDELKKSILQKAFSGELTTIQNEATA